ncbi:DUF6882 domain-containing protein [Tahibacter caeni]|uniref:DUF6882 domain-containing protein n=1 Tax=Tahibacter caeni TaxID=1453545 RepID=UPI002147A5BF|nr:DUF6882 domain-containing protein [Tahibacter caeni]
MDDEQLDTLFDEATRALDAKQAFLEREFAIGRHEEWKADLARSEIRFLQHGREAVTADVLVVGTLGHDGIWLWGWANRRLPDDVRAAGEGLKSFASLTGLDIFEQRAWEADEQQAWEMTALACRHFDANGAYCMPSASADVYVLLRHVRAVGAG